MTVSSAQRDERGSATLLALPVMAILILGALSASLVGGALTAQRRAQAAADLAALAGAGSVQYGDDPCRAVRSIAQRNGAELTYCEPRGDDVMVRVEIETAPLFGRSLSVAAQARAGPGT